MFPTSTAEITVCDGESSAAEGEVRVRALGNSNCLRMSRTLRELPVAVEASGWWTHECWVLAVPKRLKVRKPGPAVTGPSVPFWCAWKSAYPGGMSRGVRIPSDQGLLVFDVFINYRTVDARFGAAATFELLAGRFGRSRVFLDNQSMRPGAVYPERIRAALQSMRVLVVLIGPEWLASSESVLLIQRDDDWVHREIRTALTRMVPIVPVLLDGARLPEPSVLPPDVRSLVHHQTAEVRHRTLGADVARLAERLGELVPLPVSVDHVPRQLPAVASHFVGRAELMDQLDEMLLPVSGHRRMLVVLSGTAGVGKTTLALEWAHRVKHAFPDGQIYADLRGFGVERPMTPPEALSLLLRSLGVSNPDEVVDTDERAALFRTVISDRRVLLILDNALSAEQVRHLIPGDGPSAVLVTSRVRLDSLSVLHAAGRLAVSPLNHDDATRLFYAAVGERSDAEPAAVAELMHRCAYLPLAIRIAAERVVTRPALRLADLLTDLADEHVGIDALGTDDSSASVRTVFSWSYQGLDDRSALVFRAFAWHPGRDVDLEALSALTGLDQTGTRASVMALMAGHLLTELVADRYEMHDLLRAYAREVSLTDEPSAWTAGLVRLFDYYLHTAESADRALTPHRYRLTLDGDSTAGLVIDDVDTARSWFEREEANLAAMCRLDGPWLDSRRWQLAYVLRGYYYLTKKLDDWIETHNSALAATLRLGDRRAEGITRNNLGMALVASGLIEEAMAQYLAAEQAFNAVGDRYGVSNALANQATVLRRQGQYDEALLRQQRALAHFRSENSFRNLGITLRSTARVHLDRGAITDAALCADEALDIALGLQHDLDVAQAYNVVGMVRHASGDRVLAEVALHQAIEFGVRCGSRHEQARATRRLGMLAVESGDVEQAERWWHIALELFEAMGSPEASAVAADLDAMTQ